jgi:hypothetical protein
MKSLQKSCLALTVKGEPCKGHLVGNSHFCPSHHPDYRFMATGPITEKGIQKTTANLPNLSWWMGDMASC